MQRLFDPAEPARTLATAWARSSRQFSKNVTDFWRETAAANARFAAGVSENGTASEADGDAEEPRMVPGPNVGREAAIEPSMAYETEEWTVERTDETREELGVGSEVRFSKRLTDTDVASFAYAGGDTNRLHLDEEFAKKSRFGRRIAHGTLVSGTISAALARLPGLTVYLSQDLRFLKPVDIGDRVTAICEIVEDLGDDRYRLTTRVEREDGEVVIDGEAVVLIDDLPDDEE